MTPSRSRPSRTLAAVVASAALALGSSQASPAFASAEPSVHAPASTASNATPAQRQTRVLPLPVGFRPEGVTVFHTMLYASSLADGTIVGIDRASGGRRTVLAGTTGRALRGMQVDERTDLLYVAGNDGPTAIVLAIDIHTGRVANRWVVGGGGFLNDLVVTPRAVWVTDSRVDRLTRISLDRRGRPTADALSFLPLRAPWPVPDPNGIRANGIRALTDGTLLLDHSTAGGLWTVNPRSGAVKRVPVTGGTPITGGDGVEIRGNRVWVVRASGANTISELRLTRAHGALAATWVRDLADPALDVPSTAVLAGHRLWAVNARFGVADPATATYSIVGLSLR